MSDGQRIIPARAFPPGHPGRDLLTGRTPWLASRADQRFSYALQLPTAYTDEGDALPLVVAVHGTGRRAERYLDELTDFGEANGYAVMAPLFPAGIEDVNDVHNYKFIDYAGVRFDLVLLSMLDDIAARWNVEVSRFRLHGFSGGGQFAHRFLFLHPGRLSAVSIGAPGRVTLPDSSVGWWQGVGDLPDRFGVDWAPDMVAAVPTQLIIGSEDSGGEELAVVESDGHGSTRLERLATLATALRDLGSVPELTIIAGVAHDGIAVLPSVRTFLASHAR